MKHIPEFEEAREDCRQLLIELTPALHGRLGEFAAILAVESTRTNLVGPSEMSRIWGRHILESLAYSRMLDPGAPVVDVGSGAGFPGLVLAMAGFEMVLLEPRRKRFAFLGMATETLDLRRVQLRRGKLMACGPFPGGTQFVARSVMDPGKLRSQLIGVCQGSFTCTQRCGAGERVPEGALRLELPSPPLDRKGLLVQYGHHDGEANHRKGSR